jgi:hypothetical protein
VVGCMADTAPEGGYDGCARVLCLGGVSVGGVEAADFGPDGVITYEQAVCVYVVDGGDSV